MRPPSPLIGVSFCLAVLGAAASLALATAAEAEEGTGAKGERRNSIGGAVFLLPSDSPLEEDPGVELQYTRQLGSKKRQGEDGDPEGKGRRRRGLLFKGELAFWSVDRQAEGVTQKGEVDLRMLSAGVLWPFGPDSSWKLAAGAGVDYVDGDAEGTFSIAAPLAIRNDYETDADLGFHGELEAIRRVGDRWQVYLRLRYLVVSLDGEHRFVIDGVAGSPTAVKFDLDGPQLAAGFGRRF